MLSSSIYPLGVEPIEIADVESVQHVPTLGSEG
jgi:hypothetical protein